MGLAISVGALAELQQEDPQGAQQLIASLETANALLKQAGLPQHAEPAALPELQSRALIDSFPYSFLHYLRRAYAHAALDAQFFPQLGQQHVVGQRLVRHHRPIDCRTTVIGRRST